MQTITTIGLDIAKSVFQVHGVNAEGQVLIGRPRGRSNTCAGARPALARLDESEFMLRIAGRLDDGRA